MSYVLEALKKAEADRNPSARAALVQETAERRRGRWLQWTIAGALLANLVVLAWLFVPRSEPEPRATIGSSQPAATAADPPAPTTMPAPSPSGAPQAPPAESAAPGEATPAQPRTTTAAPDAVTETAAAQPVSPAPPPRVRIALGALPADVRARLPGLSFSTHVYAEDAELRAVVVNGSRLQEGGRLGELTVDEITEDGVVFAFERYLVEVSVLETWE